jgi:NTP pyrophosphatase (non-canonical NTP hydrolase)
MNYIQEAIKTESMDLFKVERPRLLHAALGVTTELLELINGTDDLNHKEEIGDVYWYLAIAADELECTFQELMSIATKNPQEIEADPGPIFVTTIGELNNLVKRACFYGLPFEDVAFGRQLGNVLLMLENACRDKNVTPEEAMEANIAKLRRRYGEKFTTEAAVNRDIDAEMEAVANG